MTQSAPVTSDSQQDAVQENSLPPILSALSDVSLPSTRGMIKVQQHLDLLLLAIEALQLGASEYMLATAHELGLQSIIKNRLSLWRLRCTNPWRQCYNRETLSLHEAKTLVLITGYSAKRIMVTLRQLLLAVQQMTEKEMPLENNFRLSQYFTRFRAHFVGRMNPGRAKVSVYQANPEQLNLLALSLLEELLFCTGTKGMERLWISLFDGEID